MRVSTPKKSSLTAVCKRSMGSGHDIGMPEDRHVGGTCCVELGAPAVDLHMLWYYLPLAPRGRSWHLGAWMLNGLEPDGGPGFLNGSRVGCRSGRWWLGWFRRLLCRPCY